MLGAVIDGTKRRPVTGSNAAPAQLAPPPTPGTSTRPRSLGGVKSGPGSHGERIASARSRSSGVKSITPSGLASWRSNGAGLVGNGCRDAVFSPGTVDCGTGRSSIGHNAGPGAAPNT